MFKEKRSLQILLSILLLIGNINSIAQGVPTVLEWQKCYGWDNADEGSRILPTQNGNFVSVGKKTLDGYETIWVSKMNQKGEIQWESIIFAENITVGFKGTDIIESGDGGFYLLGRALNPLKLKFNSSNGRQVVNTTGKGFYDNLVVKLNSEGQMQWFKLVGGSGEDMPAKILRTSDNNILILSTTSSTDGDVLNSDKNTNGLNRDFWVVKLNKDDGNIIAKKCIGGNGDDVAFDMKQTNDGGYAIVGCTNSNDAQIGPNKGGKDVLVVKIDASLNVSWKKTYGGNVSDEARRIMTLPNGELVLGITSNSFTDDFANTIYQNNFEPNIWLFKLNSSGEIQNKKLIGGTNTDVLNDLITAPDGNFIIAGSTRSNNGDIKDRDRIPSNNNGGFDMLLLKTSTNFDIFWQKTIGGSADDEGNGVMANGDGTIIAVGTTQSFDGDINGNHNSSQDNRDIVLLKLTYPNLPCEANIRTDKNLVATNTDILASETVNTSDRVTQNSSVHYGASKSVDITAGFNSEIGSTLEFNLSGCTSSLVGAIDSRPIQIKIQNECREGGMKFKFNPFTPNTDLSQYRMSVQSLSPKIEYNFTGNTLITKNNIPENGNALFIVTVSRDGFEDFSYQGYTSTCEHDGAPINCPENNNTVNLDKDYYNVGDTFTATWTGTLLPQQNLSWYNENVADISKSGNTLVGRITGFPAHIQAQPNTLPDGSRPCHGAVRVDFRATK